ncbi:MAG: oxidoreductase [Niabella sp.]
MKKICFFGFLYFTSSAYLQGQALEIYRQDSFISYRGLSIVENNIWISGSKGSVGKSANGGNTWQWYTVKGYEKNEFRDIEAFDDRTAVVMSISAPAFILKTTDGGNTWKKVYENAHPSMFLDAMAFKNNKEGIVIGDPIENNIFVAETKDGGNSWSETSILKLPAAGAGEVFFAASGSNIVFAGNRYYIVSGGLLSRIFFNKKAIRLPTLQGQQMTGANGLAIQNNTILVAGGDYHNLQRTDSVFSYSTDGGATWHLPRVMPGGYRSSVCFAGKDTAITCGITGIDISYDAGKTWKNISKEGFNTCTYSKEQHSVFFAGNNGKLGKMHL